MVELVFEIIECNKFFKKMNIEIIILLKIVNVVNCLCAICTKQTYDNVSVSNSSSK